MAIKKIEQFNKHENVETNKNPFDIENYLNANWDKIKDVANNNADELEQAQTNIENNTEEIKSIEQKNTEQDTNIGNIQKENIELKEECERLKNDLKSSVLTGQVREENIDLNDSSNARLMKLEIEGNHKQETRTGKNLYKNSSPLVPELTEDKNGFLTVNCDNTKGTTAKYINFFGALEEKIKTNTKYSIVLEIKSLTYTGESYIQTVSSDPTTKAQFYEWNQYKFSILKSGDIKIKSHNSIGDFSGCVCSTRSYVGVPINSSVNVTFRLSILEGEVTSENYSYEEYGAMPSFKFPSEVRAVGDNINIVISNKNPLKITETSVTSNGVTTTHSDNKIVSKGTVSLNWFNIISWEKCFIPANTYTISYDKTIQGRLVAKFKYADGETKSIYINPSYKKASFTLEKDTVEFILNIDQLTANDNVNFETNIQIEQGTVATDIVPHEEQNYIMPVQEKMLEDDYIDDIELHGWNTYVLTGKEKWWNTFGTNLFNVSNLLTNIKQEEHVLLSNKYKYNSVHSNINNNTKNGEFAIQFSTSSEKGNVFIKDTRFDNIDDFKKYLQDQFDGGNPVYICYKLAEPRKLQLTEEQKKVLEQIEKEAHTYKNITHIYSTDEVSPILDAEYVKDLDTVLNNLANASLVGGN